MFNKSSEVINNTNTMNTDQTTLEWGSNNVNHGSVNLNIVNSNFNDCYRRLSTDFVIFVISDGRIYSAAAFTAFLRIIFSKLLAIIIDLPLCTGEFRCNVFQIYFVDHVTIFSALYYLLAIHCVLYFARR